MDTDTDSGDAQTFARGGRLATHKSAPVFKRDDFVELFADRFGRGLNDAYTNANGSSKPNGLKYAVTTTGVTLADLY